MRAVKTSLMRLGDFVAATSLAIAVIIVASDTIGGITKRILAGETADLVIASTPSMVTLVRDATIDDKSQQTVWMEAV